MMRIEDYMKVCSECNENRHLSEYPLHRDSAKCLKCINERMRICKNARKIKNPGYDGFSLANQNLKQRQKKGI